ncbi:MAG TPA: hypothetical protein VF042_09710 [Gemmatimonadaceae bacterium]
MKERKSGPAVGCEHAEKSTNSHVRREWIAPAIETLPRLSDLTLQSGGNEIPGGGGTGGSGSTVVP